jgi:DNA primase
MSKRRDRILESVSITDVLNHLGFDVQGHGGQEQYRCTLHGGNDTAASARVYPETNSTWCWACNKYRNAIDFMMEVEDVDYNEACTKLEILCGLPVWEYTSQNKTVSLLKDAKELVSETKAKARLNVTLFRCKEYDGNDPNEWRRLSQEHLLAKQEYDNRKNS